MVEKMHPVVADQELSTDFTRMIPTFPNISKGSPRYAFRLLRSEVRNEVGRERVGALDSSGGDPQSSNVFKRPDERVNHSPKTSFLRKIVPGTKETREY